MKKELERLFANLAKGKKVHFVTGIDTNVGKTYATAFILGLLEESGLSAVSQKMVQTGCHGISEDILKHRELCGTGLLDDDRSMLTSPVVLSYPASPHLAAALDKTEIDLRKVDRSSAELAAKYDIVLEEGAGGLMVPITADGYLTIDYIAERGYPVILVTSGKLGSINHTLLTLDACRRRSIDVELMVYNAFPEIDRIIETDTLDYLQRNAGVLVLKMGIASSWAADNAKKFCDKHF